MAFVLADLAPAQTEVIKKHGSVRILCRAWPCRVKRIRSAWLVKVLIVLIAIVERCMGTASAKTWKMSLSKGPLSVESMSS